MQWYSQMSGTNKPEWASVLLFWSMYTFSWIAIKHFWLDLNIPQYHQPHLPANIPQYHQSHFPAKTPQYQSHGHPPALHGHPKPRCDGSPVAVFLHSQTCPGLASVNGLADVSHLDANASQNVSACVGRWCGCGVEDASGWHLQGGRIVRKYKCWSSGSQTIQYNYHVHFGRTVECRNTIKFVTILRSAQRWQWQNVSQTLDSQRTHHTYASMGCLWWWFQRKLPMS